MSSEEPSKKTTCEPLDSIMADMGTKNHHQSSKSSSNSKRSHNQNSRGPPKQKADSVMNFQLQKDGRKDNANQNGSGPEVVAATCSPSQAPANSEFSGLQKSINSLAGIIGGFGSKLDQVNGELQTLKQSQEAMESQMAYWADMGQSDGDQSEMDQGHHGVATHGDHEDTEGASDHSDEGEIQEDDEPTPSKKLKPNPGDLLTAVLASVRQDCGLEEHKDPPISEDLAGPFNAAATCAMTEKALSDRKAKIVDIENLSMVVAPRLNQCVWNLIPKESRTRDATLQNIQKAITKGITPIIKVADSLLKAVQGQGPMPDTRAALADLVEGSTIVLAGHCLINGYRRDQIKPDLHRDFKSVCSNTVPITTDLFGDDLEKRITELGNTNKAGNKLKFTRAVHSKPWDNRPYKSPLQNRPQYSGGYSGGYNGNYSGGNPNGGRRPNFKPQYRPRNNFLGRNPPPAKQGGAPKYKK